MKQIQRTPESLSVWESNIKEMSRIQPLLASVLVDYVTTHGHELEHYETETPAGQWIDGLTPKPFFQPVESAWKFGWSRKSKWPLFFQYGIGTPPYLFRGIRALPNDALSLIVVEPSIKLVAYTLHMTHVYKALPEIARLTFLVKPESTSQIDNLPEQERQIEVLRLHRTLMEEALAAGVTAFGIFNAIQSETTSHPGELEACRDALAVAAKEIREWTVLRLQALGNSAEDTMIGLRQMALMAPWILNGPRLDSLVGPFKGRPFVIVSAGPSLEKNFELLRDIRDKIVIVATDAVLRKLIKAGIPPHIVCALERGVPTYDLLFASAVEEYPDECAKILLIPQAVCNPKIFGRWPGPKLIAGKDEIPVDKWFIKGILRGETLSSASSVAHMNYSLAARLGASRIALIGQDLALSDDGVTHAEDIFGEERIKEERQRARTGNVYRVPGALGGEVSTTEIWLSFLRILENFIAGFKVPTSDCTEGGALIAGTTVETFADFIEKYVTPTEPMTTSPAEIIASFDLEGDRAKRVQECQIRFEAASAGLDEIEKRIDGIERVIKRVAAPGLEPARRVDAAREAGVLIDEINHGNEMFAFITQSYVYLATMDIARTRTLERIEQIESWVTSHEELVRGHRGVLVFVRNWLLYAREVLRYYEEHPLPWTPLSSEEAAEEFHSLTTETPRFAIDALLARCDPARLKWPGHDLWVLSEVLMEEGRSQEAVACLESAVEDFSGQEMPVAEMVSFFKDYARALSTHDLCFSPPYHRAEHILSHAIEATGYVDDESRQIMEDILEGEIASYNSVALALGNAGRGITKWFGARAAGERALLDGDLPRALSLVWKAIHDNWRSVPDWAASHLDWLSETLVTCSRAEDPLIKSTTERLFAEIAADEDLLGAIRIYFNETFAELLYRNGLKPDVKLLLKVSKQETEEKKEPEDTEAVTPANC